MKTIVKNAERNLQEKKSKVAIMWEKTPKNCYEYLDMRAILK
jgi:hypothetical protein